MLRKGYLESCQLLSKPTLAFFFFIIELMNFLHVVLFVGIIELGKVCSVTHMI